jgi:AraC-like DNA-binding protein
MSGYHLSSAALNGASALVLELGGNPGKIAAGLRIPAEALTRPDIPVPARAIGGFFERAAGCCACRNFGLALAARSSMAILGPLWVLMRSAQTVGQMLEDFAAHYGIFTSAATVSIQPTRAGAFLSWDTSFEVPGRSVQVAEFSLALLCRDIRQRCPAGWQPAGVQFRHAAPGQLQEHRRMFGAALQFDQDRNALFLDRRTLERPVTQPLRRSRALVKHWLAQDLERVRPGVEARVEQVVRALLPYGPCTLEDISRIVGVAPRTLQEHLEREGHSFKAIKDSVRADLALKYLQQSSLSLSQIADILGYAGLSNFSRSFRRWHGQSASAMRRKRPGRSAPEAK